MSRDDKLNLPALAFSTDFDQVKNGEILKFVDGRWSPRGGPEFPHGTRMLFRGKRRALQRWECQTLFQEIIERPGERLPSVKKLNDEIPELCAHYEGTRGSRECRGAGAFRCEPAQEQHLSLRKHAFGRSRVCRLAHH
jgi:hypothetical protein